MRGFVIGLMSVLGCHVEPPPKMPVTESWLEVTDPGYAKTHSNYTKRTALPFEFLREGVDGTQLVVQFLTMLQEKGGAYASNVAIVLQMTHNGAPIECVSKVVLAGSEPKDTASRTDGDDGDDSVGSTTIRPWHPDMVTAQVDDHKYKCERNATPVAYVNKSGTEDAMEANYMADQKRIFQLNTPSAPDIVSADWEDRCELVTEHREVRRYEHFVASHFQPPEWDKLSPIYASRKIVELPPECHAIAATGKLFQRIEADVSYTGFGPQVHTKPMPDKNKTIPDLGVYVQRFRLMDL